MIELEKLLDLAGAHAHNTLIAQKHRQLTAAFLYVTADGAATIIGCPWANDFQKQVMIAEVRTKMRAAGAKQYTFITEAWFANAPKDMPLAGVKQLRHYASKHPDRRECVVCFATDGVTTRWRQWQIKRDWKGQIRELTLLPIGDEDYLSSWLTNLLGGNA